MKVALGLAIAVVLVVACSTPAHAQFRGAQVRPGLAVGGTFHPYNGNTALFSGGTGINYGNGQFNPMIYSGFNPIDYGNGQFNPMIYNNFNPINYGNGQANRSIYNGFNPINYGNGQANRSIYNGFNPINYGNDQLVPRTFTGNAASNQGNGVNQVNGAGTGGAGVLNNSLVPQNYSSGYHGSSATRAWRAAQARAAANAAAGNAPGGNAVAGSSVTGGAGAGFQAQGVAPATSSARHYARGKAVSRAARNASNR